MELRPPRFEPHLENLFRLSLRAGALNVARVAALFAAFLFLTIGVWDELIDPGSLDETMPLRVATAVGFLVLFLLVWRREWSLRATHFLLGVGFAIATIGLSLVVAEIDNGYIAGVPGFIVALSAATVGPATHRGLLGVIGVSTVLPLIAYQVTGADTTEMLNLALWISSGGGFVYVAWRVTDLARRRAFMAERALEGERDKVDALVRKMVPGTIADRLKAGEEAISDRHDDVTVLFADLVGFTRFAESRDPFTVVGLLNDLFTRFDTLVAEHGLEKIKTLGDGYMVVGGAPLPLADSAAATVRCALAMCETLATFRAQRDLDWHLRVGIHTGPLVAGVIGTDRYSYDVWGDTVNIASRLESTGAPDEVHISKATATHLDGEFTLESLGALKLKNREPVGAFRVRRS
jgi:class 3 adenylate cyclase